MSGHEAGVVSPSSYRAIKQILSSRRPAMMLLKYPLLVLAGLGLVNVFFSAQALKPPYVYKKDLVQEYMLGRAALAGDDPYLSAEKFHKKSFEPSSDLEPRISTPHPPPVAVLSLPLGQLTYERAAVIWLVFEITCISVAVEI